jgi:hypothetical protein
MPVKEQSITVVLTGEDNETAMGADNMQIGGLI